jgi:FixJ family two-component response regulator
MMSDPDEKTTVYVIDDDPAIRTSLSAMIAVMGLQVTSCSSAEEFLDVYDDHRPGCLVLDLRLPGMDGLELMEACRQRDMRVQVIMISGHGEVSMAVEAMRSGAIDFLEKPYRADELRERILEAVRLDAAYRQQRADRQAIQARMDSLTSGEREVLDLMVAGKSNKQIVTDLKISLRTVHSRRAAILDKLHVGSRAELLQLVLKHLAGDQEASPEQ